MGTKAMFPAVGHVGTSHHVFHHPGDTRAYQN
jgi:hypothetical protein